MVQGFQAGHPVDRGRATHCVAHAGKGGNVRIPDASQDSELGKRQQDW